MEEFARDDSDDTRHEDWNPVDDRACALNHDTGDCFDLTCSEARTYPLAYLCLSSSHITDGETQA